VKNLTEQITPQQAILYIGTLPKTISYQIIASLIGLPETKVNKGCWSEFNIRLDEGKTVHCTGVIKTKRTRRYLSTITPTEVTVVNSLEAALALKVKHPRAQLWGLFDNDRNIDKRRKNLLAVYYAGSQKPSTQTHLPHYYRKHMGDRLTTHCIVVNRPKLDGKDIVNLARECLTRLTSNGRWS